ncbi:hypothetical protein ADL00_29300 [Streptomyces sp. AS58]|nr:hypothetical protein ADL00_29300 [Streptomyces sp. AS58]
MRHPATLRRARLRRRASHAAPNSAPTGPRAERGRPLAARSRRGPAGVSAAPPATPAPRGSPARRTPSPA